MHKSKLYDMAAQIAVDKLAPKPVHITISMQGGGGLSSIELPVIKRVSGGDIGDTGDFIGGYTDIEAGVDYDEPATVIQAREPLWFNMPPTPPTGQEKPRRLTPKRRGPEWEPLFPREDEPLPPLPENPLRRDRGIPPLLDLRNLFDKRSEKSPEQRFWDDIGIWRGMGRSPGALGGNPSDYLNPLHPLPPGHMGELVVQQLLADIYNKSYDDEIGEKEFMRGFQHTQEHFNKPFYDRDKEGIDPNPDYDTEEKVIAKIRAGDEDFLTPKEKEVWDRMQGIIGEDDSYLVDPVNKQSLAKILDPRGGKIDVKKMRDRPKYSIERYRKPGYRRPTKAASGGGISDLNDSININGQPHRLVWANPQEERVLKKMGGSGKKVLGKPAYFDEWSFAETVADLHGPSPTTQSYAEPSEYEYLTSEENYPDEPAMTYPSRIDTLEKEVDRTSSMARPGEGILGVTSPMIADLMKFDNISYDQLKSRLDRQQPSLRQSYNLVGDLPKKGLLGLTGDPMNMSEAIEGAYKLGFDKWRAGIGMYETDAPKAYNEWFSKQKPEDLVEGYKIGDPVGHSTRSSMNRVTEQLKNKFTAARDLASVGQEDEEPYKMTRKDYQEIANEIRDIEDFTPYDGSLPDWMPGWMKAAGGFFSRTVIGTGTVGGVPVHIHEDGTVTAISPEDSPGYDPTTQDESGREVPRRYRPKPVEKVSISETIEKEPTGIAKVLASRSEPSTLAQLNEEMQERVNRLYNRNIFT